MTPIIRVENLGKRYQLGQHARQPPTLREALASAVASPWDRLRRLAGRVSEEESFWALDDVSFEVQPGEAVGIIGRNGAGKSTLLKILSRITEPTRGRVELHGRVASLLEVGTGFHTELTGRENIFLNGAILGMSRAEIRRKFDEIVAFAEIERFLDTQVKHYSSGMYMRLAFAVAAHLQPEILVVDEVLAVGDAEFQKKCLGKMDDATKHGRTVLFVSHHMPSVTRLCRRAILLEAGRIKLDGDIFEVSSRYLQSGLGTSAERRWDDAATAPGDDVARLRAVRVLVDGIVTDTVDIRFPVTVEMEYDVRIDDARLVTCFGFFNDQGVLLFAPNDLKVTSASSSGEYSGTFLGRCVVPGNIFSEGQIRVYAEISTRHPVYQIHAAEHDTTAFQVIDTGAPGSVRAGWGRPLPGLIRPACNWHVERVLSSEIRLAAGGELCR